MLIRCSSLPAYDDCARRTAARLFHAEVIDAGFTLNKTAQNVGAAVGTATHAAVAYLLLEKMHTGNVSVNSSTIDCGNEALINATKHGVMWDDVTPTLSTGIKQVDRHVRTYANTIAREITPVAVEQELTLTTREGNTLSGHLDQSVNGVRDLKTGKFRGGNIKQYGGYSLLLRGNGNESNSVVEDYIRRVSLQDNQPAPVSTAYDVNVAEQAAARLIQRIERDYAEFRVEGDVQAFPANPTSMLCGPKFCPAWGTDFCREHKR